MRLLFVLLLVAVVVPGQDATTPTFSTGARLVLRAVKVRDSGGRPLAGLTASDFTVTENGVPQRVTVCEYQQIADAAVSARGSAAPEAGMAAVSRKMVLYFDLGGIASTSMRRAFVGAMKFLERGISSADSIAIMASSRGNLLTVQDFTSDRDLLLAALGKLMRMDRESSDEESTIGFGATNSEFNIFATNRRLATLGRATRQLERTRERKALIYFSDGWSMGQGRNLADMRALVSAARRANVEFYPIDTRGLAVQPGMGDASVASPGGVEAYNGVAGEALNEAFEQSQDALYSLAAETGGKAWLNNNNLEAGIQQAQRLYTSYYLIGYYSSNTATDGKFRRISIQVPTREKVRLDYADGYYGDKVFERMSANDRERHLEEAFLLESPITEIPLAAGVHYFQLNLDEYYVPVVVTIAGAELISDRKSGNGAGRAELDLLAEVKDSNGRTIKTLRDRVSFKVDPVSRERLASGLIEYDTGYTLLPGQYSIKFLVRDGETGRIGTLLQQFTVPNLNRVEGPMRRSSIILGPPRTKMNAALYTASRDKRQVSNPLVREGRKLIPSVTQVFDGSSSLVIFGEVYRPEATTPGPITAYAGFYRDGVKIFETAPIEFTARPGTRLNSAGVEIEVPLAPIGAGRYDCQVSFIDRRGGQMLFWRGAVWVAK